MASEPEAQPSIKIGFYSVIGALFGGITGSWASTAFGESAAFDFITTLFIFGVGAFVGIMGGTAFHTSIRNRYSTRAATRVEWTGRIGIAAIGLIIIFVAEFILVVSMEGNFQLPNPAEALLALAIGVIGIIVILKAIRPILTETTDTE